MPLENLNSGPYRKFRKEIEAHATEAAESIDQNRIEFKGALRGMFAPGLSYEDLEKSLTLEEEADIKNYLNFVTKRLEAGAISSHAYHDEILQGNINIPLNEWAPSLPINKGHDSIHAMFAYARSGGQSFVPAYMQVEKKGDEENDRISMLEEDYVLLFSALQFPSKRRKFIRFSEEPSSEEDPVMRIIQAWEKSRGGLDSAEFAKANRLPEFVTMMRNLYADMMSEEPDPKFAVHEFQRILRPLLDRLRKQAGDEQMLGSGAIPFRL